MKKEYKDQDKLRELYNKFGTGVLVAEYLGVSYKVLQRYLRKYGITNRYGGRRTIDETYFQDVSREDQAYFLGFFMADGYMSKEYDRFQINLKKEDIYILNKFKECSNSDALISLRYPKVQGKIYEACGMSICNKQIIAQLVNLGLVSGKENRCSLPGIDNKLMCHFLRGYFDADGYIYKNHKERQKPIFSAGFCGREQIISEIKEALELNNIHAKLYYNSRSSVIVNLFASSQAYIESLYNFLYNSATIYLERKHRIFIEALQSFSPEGL